MKWQNENPQTRKSVVDLQTYVGKFGTSDSVAVATPITWIIRYLLR